MTRRFQRALSAGVAAAGGAHGRRGPGDYQRGWPWRSELVAAAVPPLTPEQRDRLSVLLAPSATRGTSGATGQGRGWWSRSATLVSAKPGWRW
jgi:hypothetical protein